MKLPKFPPFDREEPPIKLLLQAAMATFASFALPLTFFVWLSISCNVGAIPPRITLNMTNALESHQQLTVHCKSGDDDLGIHQLPFLISYAFSFKPNVLGTTLFYCSFQWPGSFRYFEIYKDSRDKGLCTLCLWIVGEKGLCLYNYRTIKYDICYGWPAKVQNHLQP